MMRNVESLRAKGATIGEGVFIADEVDVDPGNEGLLFIRDGAVISRRVSFILHDSAANNVSGLPILFAPIVVGPRAYIGVGAIVLCGVAIGERAIVGAGSVVTSDVAPRTVVAGNPARMIGSLADYERRILARSGSPGMHEFWWDTVPWRARVETTEAYQHVREWKSEIKAAIGAGDAQT